LTKVEAAVRAARLSMSQLGKATRANLDAQASRFNELLSKGEILQTADFMNRRGMSRQALSKAVLANRVFFLKSGPVTAYPAFFVDDRYNRKQLEQVSKQLADLPGGSKWVSSRHRKARWQSPGE
jgi:hypothetical protein